jgi:hypothetical protein
MMQFTCPFCRRKPTIKTLTRYNRDAVTLGGLMGALEDRRFFYAWCVDCGYAKRAYERTSCTEERIPPITEFRCRECVPKLTHVAEPENEFATEHSRWKEKKAALARESVAWKDVPGVRTVICPNPKCQARINKVCTFRIPEISMNH